MHSKPHIPVQALLLPLAGHGSQAHSCNASFAGGISHVGYFPKLHYNLSDNENPLVIPHGRNPGQVLSKALAGPCSQAHSCNEKLDSLFSSCHTALQAVQ